MARILVIDDDVAVRSAFALALEDLPAELDLADSGASGIASAAGRRADLIFLDLKMPELDGIDTLRALRAAGCDAAVFVVTGFAEEFMPRLRAASEEGLDFDVMRKPMRRDEIRSVVDAVLAEELSE